MAGFLTTILDTISSSSEPHYIDHFADELKDLMPNGEELFDLLFDYLETHDIELCETQRNNASEIEWALITLDLRQYSSPNAQKRAADFRSFITEMCEGL